jgi:twitching motility protein PilT
MERTGGPAVGAISVEFADWLRELAQTEGSDLHLKADSPPMIREAGVLRRLSRSPLTEPELESLAGVIIPERRRAIFEEDGEVDFAHPVPGVGRFRANVFRQRTAVSMVLRKLRMGGPTFEEMRLPPVIQRLSDESRGLILVTGPTGSGKTTTLAAMIQHINATRPLHIVTIEDPIEVLHKDELASINQREIGQDSKSFLKALRAALRQDPDVILIGEMRDAETVQAALQAAETGHLVLSTLHTVDATETVNRIIDFFPADQQKQVRLTLAGVLRGIACQRLVPAIGGGRVACLEVLVNTGRISERIVDPDTTAEIHDVVADGAYYGMQTFDQALLELVKLGDVSMESALEASSSPHDFQLAAQQEQAAPEPPRFDRDIKPLFAEQDRRSMLWAFDVWDYGSASSKAAEILEQLTRKNFPVDDPWPEERLAVFAEWAADPRP